MVETRGPRHPRQAVERAELLATKLIIPRGRPEYLERTRLHEALDRATARELTVVCAPAGSGKTTLLAEWARTTRLPIAWLSLDPEDSDPIRFWRYVVGAVERAGILAPERVAPLITSNDLSSRGVVSALVNELEGLPNEVALVIDDYHVVASEAIHDEMNFLVSHLPPRLHLVIASRTDPPLPLGRLRARGDLSELRLADLRFTLEEAGGFLRETWDLHLPHEVVAAVESRTEGWAVGLQLAALTLRERQDPEAFLEAFTGSHRYVLDYLSEEVLDRQPDTVRTFLLQTSILDRLSGSLCDAVTGRSDSQAMLEDLERANLFLAPLDEERRWYRSHQLFGDLLRARLRHSDAELAAELHRRAAGWFEEHGLVDDAVRHASMSGDTVRASNLVEQHLGETLRRGEEVVVARWLSQLPEDTVHSLPALCLAQGLMLFHRGDLISAARLAEHAERAFALATDRTRAEVPTTGGMVAEIPAAIALLRAEIAAAKGDSEATTVQATSAVAHTTEQEPGAHFWARWLLAFADWMQGNLEEAERAFSQMLVEGRMNPELNPVMSTGSTLGRIQRARGKLGAALRTYEEGLRFVTQSGRLSIAHAGELHVGIARVLYERDKLDAALQHVTEGIELCRHAMVLRERDRGLATLAWIRHANGDADAALRAMDEACREYPSLDASPLFNPAPAERARLWLAQGRIDDTARWIEERGIGAEDAVAYPSEADYIVLARLLLATSHPDRASKLLARLDALADGQGRWGNLVEIRGLRALALQASGDHKGALTQLRDTVSLAAPEGYVRAFVDLGPPMAVLVQSLVRVRQPGDGAAMSEATRQHTLRVVQGFRARPPDHDAGHDVPGLVEPLTRREVEVLELVAAGRANKDIATELVVTLDTVKRHVSHIFDKLGAGSRTEAVARARELHLIR